MIAAPKQRYEHDQAEGDFGRSCKALWTPAEDCVRSADVDGRYTRRVRNIFKLARELDCEAADRAPKIDAIDVAENSSLRSFMMPRPKLGLEGIVSSARTQFTVLAVARLVQDEER